MNENLRIPAAIMPPAMLKPGGARDLAIFGVCLKGNATALRSVALLQEFLDIPVMLLTARDDQHTIRFGGSTDALRLCIALLRLDMRGKDSKL
jgi:hypothetical protein